MPGVSDNLKIVIVDDDPDDHFIMRTILAKYHGLTIISLYSGEQFMNFLSEKGNYGLFGNIEPDLVLLDINMPKISGLEILADLRGNNRFKKINVKVLSTNFTDEDKSRCKLLHTEIFKKPDRMSEFESLLEDILVKVTIAKNSIG